jgi:hypothetical protein
MGMNVVEEGSDGEKAWKDVQLDPTLVVVIIVLPCDSLSELDSEQLN